MLVMVKMVAVARNPPGEAKYFVTVFHLCALADLVSLENRVGSEHESPSVGRSLRPGQSLPRARRGEKWALAIS